MDCAATLSLPASCSEAGLREAARKCSVEGKSPGRLSIADFGFLPEHPRDPADSPRVLTHSLQEHRTRLQI